MCDRALLAARSIKGQYGIYFAAYDDKLRDELLRQRAIIDSMETALEEGQFLVYLQPKYRICDETMAGAEALVRWKLIRNGDSSRRRNLFHCLKRTDLSQNWISMCGIRPAVICADGTMRATRPCLSP